VSPASDWDNVAANIAERVLGEGGFFAPPGYFNRFKETGAMFAMPHLGVDAHHTTVAKRLAGGLPLSAAAAQTAFYPVNMLDLAAGGIRPETDRGTLSFILTGRGRIMFPRY
jgi:4-aminobutyrate aminotransferase-like enzyme